jgi:hypothetical protein
MTITQNANFRPAIKKFLTYNLKKISVNFAKKWQYIIIYEIKPNILQNNLVQIVC